MKNYKNVAFAAMRMQGFHNGHFNLISKMLRDNDLVIIGLGSTQIERTLSNPFTPTERIEMVKKVFGDSSKIKIVHLVDQGAVSKKTWVDYCLNTIFKKNLPTPNRYYSGCETDASWFSDSLNINEEKIEVIIMDRFSSGIMSATEVRKSIANAIVNPTMTSHEWKRFVPESLHDYLLEKFPKELTLEYQLQKKSY